MQGATIRRVRAASGCMGCRLSCFRNDDTRFSSRTKRYISLYVCWYVCMCMNLCMYIRTYVWGVGCLVFKMLTLDYLHERRSTSVCLYVWFVYVCMHVWGVGCLAFEMMMLDFLHEQKGRLFGMCVRFVRVCM